MGKKARRVADWREMQSCAERPRIGFERRD
jgi:hypothetical protein